MRAPFRMAACAAALYYALPAQAALVENLTTSVVAMALGNAVTADPPGIDSVHFNPAGLARLEGDLTQHTAFGASIRASATFTRPDNFDIGGWKDDPISGASTGPMRQTMYIPAYGMPGWRLPGVIVPTLGFAWHNPDSRWTFATNSYMAQAISLDRTTDPNDPGRFDGRQIQLQRLVYASPAVGYKYSDTLRFGAAVPIAHSAFVVDTQMRFPNQLLGIFGKLQQGWCPEDGGNIIDTFGFGLCGGGKEGMVNPFKKAAAMRLEMTAPVDPTLNLGVLWEPAPWFALGAVYQGGSKTRYTGKYEFDTAPMLRNFVKGLNSSLFGPVAGAILGLPQYIPEVQKGNMSATIPFPSHLQVGVKFKPVRFVQLNVDASYARWSDWNQLVFEFDQSIKLLEVARLYGIPDSTRLKIPRGYKSVLNMGYGLQLFPFDGMALRFGYEPRKSSIPLDKIDLIAPLPDTKLYSLGLNWKFSKKYELNLTGSYMKGKFDAPAETSDNMNSSKFLNIIYNPYAGHDVAGDIKVRYFGFSLVEHF
jgi:long-subunit fatty acid transport protein